MRKKLNRVITTIMVAAIATAALAGCAQNGKTSTSQQSEQIPSTEKVQADSNKLNVVATIFPEYDFLRQIAGDHINLTMLMTPGAESHSFEPTPQDMKEVIASDLFVYVGGDSDAWVESILDSVDTDKTHIVTLMDCVDTVEEEVVEGMTPEDEEADEDVQEDATDHLDEGEAEYDEHVWTSPENAKLICQKLSDNLCELDPANAEEYQQNTKDYIDKLEELDGQFRDVVENAARTEIIVGDRFPFRYFVDEYGLSYYAAFPGCSGDTEASAATIAFLQDKVKTDKIPVVFHIELSNENVCNAICEETGAKSMQLNAVHNITKVDFEAGVTYLDLMEQNVAALQEALN